MSNGEEFGTRLRDLPPRGTPDGRDEAYGAKYDEPDLTASRQSTWAEYVTQASQARLVETDTLRDQEQALTDTLADGRLIAHRGRDGLQLYLNGRWRSLGGGYLDHGQHLVPLSHVARWVVPAGATNKRAADYINTRSGAQGVRCVPNGTDPLQIECVLDQAEDLDGLNLYMRWFHDAADPTSFQVSVYLMTDDSRYRRFLIQHQNPISGWNERVLPAVHPDWTQTPGFDARHIEKVRLEVLSAAGGHTTTFDHLAVIRGDEPAIVIITADDADIWVVNTAEPILDTYGFAMTLFCPTSLVGDTGRLTVSQLTGLQAKGYDVASHGMNHVDLTTLTLQEAEGEISGAQSWLRSNGFTEGAWYLSWPFSETNHDLVAISRKYLKAARTGVGNDWFLPVAPEVDRHFRLPGVTVDSLDSTAFDALLAEAIAYGAVLPLYYHTKAGPGFDSDMAKLRQLSDDGQITVMTLSEYQAYVEHRFHGDWTADQNPSALPVRSTEPNWRLDAAKNVTDTAGSISSWVDDQGNDYVQGTADNQPQLLASAINGLPAAVFDGNDWLECGNVVAKGSRGAVTGVVRPTDPASSDRFFSGGQLSSSSRYVMLGIGAENMLIGVHNDVSLEDSRTDEAGLITDTPMILTLGSNDTEYFCRINGQAKQVLVGPNDGRWWADLNALDGFRIGARANTAGSYYWVGQVAEIVCWDGFVDLGAILREELFLSGKYAIPLA